MMESFGYGYYNHCLNKVIGKLLCYSGPRITIRSRLQLQFSQDHHKAYIWIIYIIHSKFHIIAIDVNICAILRLIRHIYFRYTYHIYTVYKRHIYDYNLINSLDYSILYMIMMSKFLQSGRLATNSWGRCNKF